MLSNNNTFSGTNAFANTTFTNATSTTFAITNLANTLLAVNANGTVVATSTIGNNQLQNSSVTINSANVALGGSATITAASSTLLANNNTFSGNNTFNNTITGSVSGNAGTATALQNARTINGVSFNGTANITIAAASSTLLTDNNSFTGATIFANATSTNFFSVTASSTNLFAQSASFGSLNLLDSVHLQAASCHKRPPPSSGAFTTTGAATVGNLINNGISANTLLYGNGSKQESSVTLPSYITLTSGTLAISQLPIAQGGTNAISYTQGQLPELQRNIIRFD